MIVGLLAMLFILISAYIVLARNDRQSLRMVAQSEQVTEIMESLYGVIEGAITDADGGDRVTGTAYVDAPGLAGVVTGTNTAWGSPWLASPEPVLAPSVSATIAEPAHYRVPAVTSVSGGASGTVLLTNLLVDANRDGDSTNDLAANALLPFMDADGDGIPDASFAASAVLTELANSIAGRAVSATGINPADLDPSNLPDTNVRRWEQFDQQARYEVAAKVVSHGGMVQVSQSLSAQMWNSGFLYGMFAWVQHPSDSGAPTYQQLYNMYAQSAAIEPILRRRGGLLPEARGLAAGNVPPALSAVYEDFGNTFTPLALSGKTGAWQRFNLADQTDWRLWRQAATIDPEQYYVNPIVQRNAYASRQVLTTVNNSDELARINKAKQLHDPSLPNYWDGTGLPPGKLKFYLGRITDPVTGAFDVDGYYEPTRGPRIVLELANYFFEMLSGHKEWRGTGGGSEIVTRREQACMLAVNTVAFAAPRQPRNSANPGFIDNVYFVDGNTAGAGKMYVGYAPQPFITQVMAYRERQTTGGTSTALAIELYNPNDRGPDNDPTDPNYALYLPQYAISLNSDYEGSGFDPNIPVRLSNSGASGGTKGRGVNFPLRMPGRTFLTIIVNDRTGNTYFENSQSYDPTSPVGLTSPVIDDLSVNFSPPTMKVKLWRQGSSGPAWVLVDEFELQTPEDEPADPASSWAGAVVNAWRDTNSELYFGYDSLGNAARWRCVMARPYDAASSSTYESYDDTTPHGSSLLQSLNGPGPGTGTITSPCTPLYTMNADRVWTYLHGMARPASFPTVGFMLFVPRFAHYGSWLQTAGGATWSTPLHSVSTLLYDDWEEKPYTLPNMYPADFGHMPIFENKQDVESTDGGFSRTGSLPWGLLVFDYFTALNPNDANGDGTEGDTLDPYRVPGRININTAPWYVLAGLPVIGPVRWPDRDLACGYVNAATGVTTGASPAFWSASSGILTGSIAGMGYRFPQLLDTASAANGQWYRLGPHLGQAVAAYRDRVQYVNAASSGLALAYDRANANVVYRPDITSGMTADYGSVRSGSGQRGFLTIGELANVMGFDGTDDTGDLGGTFGSNGSDTVLGGYTMSLFGGAGVGGDFMKAVSLLALLDTNFLTTRSNTFTIYVSLTDRVNPQSSVRSQVTIDRTNLLPRLVWEDRNANGRQDPWLIDYYHVLPGTGRPEIIGQREVSYFNARYDE